MEQMRLTCRVLLLLSDSEKELSTKQIASHLDLTEQQVNSAVKSLRIKQKVESFNRLGVNLHRFNDDYIPSTRPVKVSCVSPAAKASLEKETPEKLMNCFMFAQQKVNLLEKMKKKVSLQDRDLIIGMINDYSSRIRKIS